MLLKNVSAYFLNVLQKGTHYKHIYWVILYCEFLGKVLSHIKAWAHCWQVTSAGVGLRPGGQKVSFKSVIMLLKNSSTFSCWHLWFF